METHEPADRQALCKVRGHRSRDFLARFTPDSIRKQFGLIRLQNAQRIKNIVQICPPFQ